MSQDADRPPEKRRKTDEDVSPTRDKALSRFEAMWDEDIEFSQADIQSLEILESQAYLNAAKPEQHHEQGSSDVKKHSTEVRRENTAPMAVEFQLPPPRSTSSRLYQKTSSSASSLSLARTSSSSASTAYPSSLSTRTSSDVHTASLVSTSTSGSSRPSLDTESRDPRHVFEEIQILKTKIDVLQKERSQATDDIYSKEGEIKILRSQFREKENELMRMKEDRLHSLDQMRSQKSAFEDALKTERDRAHTQGQFREQEFRELEERCRLLETKAQSAPCPSQLSSPARSPLPRHVKVQTSPSPKPLSPPPSPAPRRPRAVTPPRARRGFPSSMSFMAEEASQTVDPRPSTSAGECGQGDRGITRTARRRHARKHVVNTRVSKGEISGSTLVSHLLQHCPAGHPCNLDHPAGHPCPPDQGLIALLHPPTTPHYLHNVQFDRDQSFLSPVRSKTLSDANPSPRRLEGIGESHPIVPGDHYLMAIRGLQDLLQTPARHPDQNPPPLRPPTSVEREVHLSGAVLILPLINDYLSRYIDMLNTTPSTSSSSLSGSQSSASLTRASLSGSSLESVTSAMGVLLRDCRHFANNLEALCLSCLRTLGQLATFSEAVRSSLMDKTDWNENEAGISLGSSSSGECAMDTDGLVTSSSDTDCASLESRVTFQQLQELNLLHAVATLAHPLHENYSVHIVEEALDIALILASQWSEPHLVRLQTALGRGALSSCLGGSIEPSRLGLVTRSVQVLGQLTRSQKVAQAICTKSESCPLLQLYFLRSKLTEAVPRESRAVIYQQIVLCMTNLTRHPGNASLILSSNCRCSVEAARCLITCLLRLYEDYLSGQQGHLQQGHLQQGHLQQGHLQQGHLEQGHLQQGHLQQGHLQQNLLQGLRDGLLLLHHLQPQLNYPSDRDYHLDHEYVTLICGLSSLFRKLPGSQDVELNALSELWDFEQDDSELSLDSDQDSMET